MFVKRVSFDGAALIARPAAFRTIQGWWGANAASYESLRAFPNSAFSSVVSISNNVATKIVNQCILTRCLPVEAYVHSQLSFLSLLNIFALLSPFNSIIFNSTSERIAYYSDMSWGLPIFSIRKVLFFRMSTALSLTSLKAMYIALPKLPSSMTISSNKSQNVLIGIASLFCAHIHAYFSNLFKLNTLGSSNY